MIRGSHKPWPVSLWFAVLLALFVCMMSAAAYSAALVYRDSNPALGGYDVVAYFTESRAVPGQKNISYAWANKTWRFSSEENRQRFIQSPQAYAPQYEGVCAYAVSQHAIAPVDPEAWSIVNGKLYLNNSPGVRTRWQQNQAEYIRQGDLNWPSLSR